MPRECRERALAVLLAGLALFSVIAMLALGNYIYDGLVCSERPSAFLDQPSLNEVEEVGLDEVGAPESVRASRRT